MNLTDSTKKTITWLVLLVIATAMSLAGGVSYPLPPAPFEAPVELGTTHFTAIEAEDITATDDLVVTDDSTLTDDTAIGGDLTVTGAASVTGNTTLAALLLASTTTVTVTDGDIITPTTTAYILDAAAAVTITLGSACTDGQPLFTFGNDAVTVTIDDTNVRTNDGALQTVGQYDLVSWICISSEWVEISDSANS